MDAGALIGMHVAISVDSLTPHLSGIGRYCWELVNGLSLDPRVKGVTSFIGNRWVTDLDGLLDGTAAPAPFSKRWKTRLRRWYYHGRFSDGLVHSPNYFLPDWADGGVATVHDLSIFRYPETHPAERIQAFEKNFSSTIKRANLILTDCEWVRREVMEFTGLAGSRVRAVPLGVSDAFRVRQSDEIRQELSSMGLQPGTYGLCVSTLEPRKRIGHLLTAWRELPMYLRLRYPLVLAGGAGWRNEALMHQIEQGIDEGWLHYLGYVPEGRLPTLYAGARVFAYPSVYEGFGFPPLEAMACGVPTLVASGTCLEEVAGQGAVARDPEDISAMKQTLEQMLTSEEWRSELSAAGLHATSRYRWSVCIDQTIDAYQSIF